MENKDFKYRWSLMAMAMLTLLAATWAGLLRLGWQWPMLRPTLALSHGPLMVAGFFGTLISLERAVAMGKTWTYVGPLLSGIGGVLIAFGIGDLVGPVLVTLGSLWLILIFIVVLQQHFTGYLVVLALGALALLVGNLLWLLGWQVYQIVWWWAGFLILTIAGERLELGRIVKKPDYTHLFFSTVTGILIAGLVTVLFAADFGVRMIGIGMLGLAFWLLGFDIARQTVKLTGLTRFIAVCLLTGYVWLLVAGVITLVYGAIRAGPIYDAMLHAIFLGFVFSMIFGHAPIIFPAVLGANIRYQHNFYIPLVVLHISLIIRIFGELLGSGEARLWGGLLNVIAVLVYVGIIILNHLNDSLSPNPPDH